jgi:hypothetical protein
MAIVSKRTKSDEKKKNGRKIKGPRRTLSIRQVLSETRSGKGIWVILRTGVKVCLPKAYTDFQVEDWGERIAVIPLWLKQKIDKELAGENGAKKKQADKIPF